MSVDFRSHRQKWRARISVNRNRIDLGEFETQAEAMVAYADALKEHGPTRTVKVRAKSDPATRFASKTSIAENGCVLWLGATDKDGYGKFQLNGNGVQKHVRAHRFSYFLKHGEWPEELVLHACDTPSCVDPDHLESGDQGKNVRDCVARGRHRPGGRGTAA